MISYAGKELELFKNASHWKKYFASFLSPYINGHVLEVGAGIGSTTQVLCDGSQASWTCLEPDPGMAAQLNELIISKKLPAQCKVVHGTLKENISSMSYDVILYIDVIEHIADDRKEIQTAKQLLKAGGFLILLVPAHPWLFSPFDKAIGHYRRYNKKKLKQIIPKEMIETSLSYIDFAGVLASAGNKLLLKKSYPSLQQIKFWDNYLIPISRKIDFLTKSIAGRSLIGIWQKES